MANRIITGYDARVRTGKRMTTSVQPRDMILDIDKKVRELDRYKYPWQTISTIFPRGPKPKAAKLQTIQSDEYNHYDKITSAVAGLVGNTETRFARITLEALTMQSYGGNIYSPQDKFWIASTNQVVEVVMTDSKALVVNGGEITLSTALTGATATRSLPGTIVVRVVKQEPFKAPGNSDVAFLGNVLSESQTIYSHSWQYDNIYDADYVEHKDVTFEMSEDQYNYAKQAGGIDDFTYQQKRRINDFKKEIEYNAMFSQKAMELTPDGMKYHMTGINDAIVTNRAFYDPATTLDFENQILNFLHSQAFRYNPNGTNKLAFVGAGIQKNFSQAFKDYRRTSKLAEIGEKVGLNLSTYEIPGGESITMAISPILQVGTPLEDWMFVLDPKEAEWRIMKEYESKDYTMPNERAKHIMTEWQGGIAFHREQSMATLQTII